MESIEPQRLSWSTVLNSDRTQGDMSQASITAQFHACGRPTSFQLQWSGTPTGAFSFKASNRHDPAQPSLTKWTTLDSSLFSPALVNPAGSASDTAVVFPAVPFEWIQVVYTRSASSGTLLADAKAIF